VEALTEYDEAGGVEADRHFQRLVADGRVYQRRTREELVLITRVVPRDEGTYRWRQRSRSQRQDQAF